MLAALCRFIYFKNSSRHPFSVEKQNPLRLLSLATNNSDFNPNSMRWCSCPLCEEMGGFCCTRLRK